MNLLQVAVNYPPAQLMGGSQEAMSDLAGVLARHWPVRVLTTNFGGREAAPLLAGREVRNDGVEIVRLPLAPNASRMTRFHRSWWPVIRELVRWADVVHLSEVRTTLNLAVSLAARDERCIQVLSPWGSGGHVGGYSRRALRRACWDHSLGRLVLSGVEIFLAQTREEARDISRLPAARGRTAFLPLGLSSEQLRNGVTQQPALEREGPLRLLVVARLSPLKGIDTVLRSVARLEPGAVELTIVGRDEGALPQLRALVSRLELGTAVRFVGPVYGEPLQHYLINADVFILTPTYSEGTSLAALQAAAFFTTAIVSPQAGFPYLAAYGAGWCVEPTEAPIASAIREAIVEKGRDGLRVRKFAARRMVEERHGLQHVADEFTHLIESIVKRPVQGAPE